MNTTLEDVKKTFNFFYILQLNYKEFLNKRAKVNFFGKPFSTFSSNVRSIYNASDSQKLEAEYLKKRKTRGWLPEAERPRNYEEDIDKILSTLYNSPGLDGNYGIELEFLSSSNRYVMAHRINSCMLSQNIDIWRKNFDGLCKIGPMLFQECEYTLSRSSRKNGKALKISDHNMRDNFNVYSSFFIETSEKYGTTTNKGLPCNWGDGPIKIENDSSVCFEEHHMGLTMWNMNLIRNSDICDINGNAKQKFVPSTLRSTGFNDAQLILSNIGQQKKKIYDTTMPWNTSLAYNATFITPILDDLQIDLTKSTDKGPEQQGEVVLSKLKPNHNFKSTTGSETDGSISRIGFYDGNEMVTPVLNNQYVSYAKVYNPSTTKYSEKFVPFGSILIDNVCTQLKSHQNVTAVPGGGAGFHIHLSYPDINWRKNYTDLGSRELYLLAGFIKLFWLFEPLIYSFQPPYRAQSSWSQNIQSIFTYTEILTLTNLQIVKRLINPSSTEVGLWERGGARYVATNLTNIKEGGLGTIEIRIGHSTLNSSYIQALINIYQNIMFLNMSLYESWKNESKLKSLQFSPTYYILKLSYGIRAIPLYTSCYDTYIGGTHAKTSLGINPRTFGQLYIPSSGFFIHQYGKPERSIIISTLCKIYESLTGDSWTLKYMIKNATNYYYGNGSLGAPKDSVPGKGDYINYDQAISQNILEHISIYSINPDTYNYETSVNLEDHEWQTDLGLRTIRTKFYRDDLINKLSYIDLNPGYTKTWRIGAEEWIVGLHQTSWHKGIFKNPTEKIKHEKMLTKENLWNKWQSYKMFTRRKNGYLPGIMDDNYLDNECKNCYKNELTDTCVRDYNNGTSPRIFATNRSSINDTDWDINEFRDETNLYFAPSRCLPTPNSWAGYYKTQPELMATKIKNNPVKSTNIKRTIEFDPNKYLWIKKIFNNTYGEVLPYWNVPGWQSGGSTKVSKDIIPISIEKQFYSLNNGADHISVVFTSKNDAFAKYSSNNEYIPGLSKILTKLIREKHINKKILNILVEHKMLEPSIYKESILEMWKWKLFLTKIQKLTKLSEHKILDIVKIYIEPSVKKRTYKSFTYTKPDIPVLNTIKMTAGGSVGYKYKKLLPKYKNKLHKYETSYFSD